MRFFAASEDIIMPNVAALQDFHAPIRSQPLACRLRSKEHIGRHGPVPFTAEVELENLSDAPLEIEYRMAVLQYLHLVVRDSQGCVVSEGHFGDRFSPFEKDQVLRLGPGESYKHNVHFFATVPKAQRTPGTYSVQAVYEYNGFRAESDPVEVTVEASK
jgi:hypothetical protein